MFKYQKLINRERQFPVVREQLQSDGTVKITREKEPLVLVGFGKHDLVDFIGSIDLVNEAFVKNWPPRYRRQSICIKDEIDLFHEFTTWLTKQATKR